MFSNGVGCGCVLKALAVVMSEERCEVEVLLDLAGTKRNSMEVTLEKVCFYRAY